MAFFVFLGVNKGRFQKGVGKIWRCGCRNFGYNGDIAFLGGRFCVYSGPKTRELNMLCVVLMARSEATRAEVAFMLHQFCEGYEL